MKNIYLALVALLAFTGCSSIMMIKYQKLPDDVYANNNLREYLKGNRSPKIVLRVPNSNDKATSNTKNTQNNDVLYNAIEKEFLREGFSVRDRGLFNEIIDKSQSTDYSKIGQETDTDLILEVVNINTNVEYSTNKVTIVKKSGNSDEIQP